MILTYSFYFCDMRLLKNLKTIIFDILFPPLCLACEKYIGKNCVELICQPCASSITILSAPQCPTCGGRLPMNTKACHSNAPYLLAAATTYANPAIQQLIWQLKFKHHSAAAKILAQLLNRHIQASNLKLSSFLIVPVPLHISRERKRGYNQSALIAKELGALLNIPVELNALTKIHATEAQTKMKTHADRKKNLINAFKCDELSKSQIVLVDDVTTSGATLEEAVKALRQAGAHRVIAAVVARA